MQRTAVVECHSAACRGERFDGTTFDRTFSSWSQRSLLRLNQNL